MLLFLLSLRGCSRVLGALCQGWGSKTKYENKRCLPCSYHLENYKGFRSSVPGPGSRPRYIFCYLIGTEIEERFYLVGNLFFLWAGSAQHDLPVRASALTVPVHRASLTVCLHTIRILLERIAQLVFHGANLFLAC